MADGARPRGTASAKSAVEGRCLVMSRDSIDIRTRMAELGRRSAQARRHGLVLTADEVAALAEAYELLRRAAQRARRKLAAAVTPTGEEAGHAQ